MTEVSKDEFFARVGPLNVHPSIPGGWDDERGYRSEWRLQDGSRMLIGITDGLSIHGNERYFLAK